MKIETAEQLVDACKKVAGEKMVEKLQPGSGIVQSLAAQFGMQMPTMPMARGAEGGGSRVRVNSLGKPVAESEKVQRARENARQIVRK